MNFSYFQMGDNVDLCYERDRPSRVEMILPTTVVADGPEHTILYATAGTPLQKLMPLNNKPVSRDIPYAELAAMERTLQKGEWTSTNVLFIWKPEWHWDVRLYWRAGTEEFLGWYVNIQDQMRRTEKGFHTIDHLLDIEVAPDRTFALKDEDELNDAVSLGMYTEFEGDLIREQARDASLLITGWQWPFNTDPGSFRLPLR